MGDRLGGSGRGLSNRIESVSSPGGGCLLCASVGVRLAYKVAPGVISEGSRPSSIVSHGRGLAELIVAGVGGCVSKCICLAHKIAAIGVIEEGIPDKLCCAVWRGLLGSDVAVGVVGAAGGGDEVMRIQCDWGDVWTNNQAVTYYGGPAPGPADIFKCEDWMAILVISIQGTILPRIIRHGIRIMANPLFYYQS